jgi:hypothetical protein
VKRLTIIIVAVSVLLAAGCSTGHPADPKVTATNVPVDGAFVAKADAACTAEVKTVAERKFPYLDFNPNDPAVSELPGVGAFYDSSAFSHNEVAFVQNLGVPPTGQGTWKAFVGLVSQEQSALAAQITAAKESNKANFVNSVKQLATIESEIDSNTAAAGFSVDSDCVTLFG